MGCRRLNHKTFTYPLGQPIGDGNRGADPGMWAGASVTQIMGAVGVIFGNTLRTRGGVGCLHGLSCKCRWTRRRTPSTAG